MFQSLLNHPRYHFYWGQHGQPSLFVSPFPTQLPRVDFSNFWGWYSPSSLWFTNYFSHLQIGFSKCHQWPKKAEKGIIHFKWFCSIFSRWVITAPLIITVFPRLNLHVLIGAPEYHFRDLNHISLFNHSKEKINLKLLEISQIVKKELSFSGGHNAENCPFLRHGMVIWRAK